MVSAWVFTSLVAVVAIQRLAEVRKSKRHEAELSANGAREHAAWQVPVMATLHTSWLIAIVVEIWWNSPVIRPGVTAAALMVFCAGQILRLVAMSTLGPRWTIRVMTLPGTAPVVGGIYKFVRHPNYLGVVLEIAALPVACGAYRTAVSMSLLNAWLLVLRIRAEERALAEDNRYFEHFGASRGGAAPSNRPHV